MITKEDIDRINFLSRKSREQELSEEEKIEQQTLRRKYIDYIKFQVKGQMDSIKFVEDECGCGNPEHHKHEKHECGCSNGDHHKQHKQHKHGDGCGCGKHHHHKH